VIVSWCVASKVYVCVCVCVCVCVRARTHACVCACLRAYEGDNVCFVHIKQSRQAWCKALDLDVGLCVKARIALPNINLRLMFTVVSQCVCVISLALIRCNSGGWRGSLPFPPQVARFTSR